MLIGIVSYFPTKFEGANDGLRENGNLRFLELLKTARRSNIIFEQYVKKRHKKYDLLLCTNEPRINSLLEILIRNILVKNINIFYMADETPLGRKRNSLLLPIIYKKILINCLKSERLSRKNKYLLYTSASIPDKSYIEERKEFILKSDRKKLLCYVGGNILALSKKGSYKFRNKLVRGLSKNKKFSLYGRRWDQGVIPIDFPLIAIINRIPLIKNLLIKYYKKKYPTITNQGSIESKLDTINEYNFTLSIEPYIGEPKMLLEKIFDPMLSGSIPVYFGPKDIDVPENIFIRIDKNIKPDELIAFLDSFSEDKIRKYRKRIYDYLISDKSNRFRYSYYAEQIVDIFKNEMY